MNLVNTIADFIDKVNDTDLLIIIGFIGDISFTVTTLYILMKKRNHFAKYFQQQSLSRDILISVISIFCGILSPLYLIYLSFSNWSGWQLWLTQILSWYVLLSFIVLVYIILSMNKSLNNTD